MKRYSPLMLLAAILFMGVSSPDLSYQGNSETLCHAMATWNQMAATEGFSELHPYVRKIAPDFSAKGKMITYKTSGGEEGNAYLVKADKKTNKYIFVIHEWWGLNDNIKQEAEKLAKDLGVNALALDFYDGKVAEKSAGAMKLMTGVKQKRANELIKGAMAYAGEDAKIATIGWCFGGGWSLQTALELGDQAVGCVMYYGMPEQDVDRLKTLKTDVLGIFAGLEGRINPKVVAEFQGNMKKAGKKITIHSFNAEHAFANPSGARYDKESAEIAYMLTLKYLNGRFGV
ncbi:MAG: dienelactone hydrolase family protein [Bacteroidia bacterium]|nr:dienelactone hydrolase family protein [Bacteroidia bacterium]